MTAAAVSMRNVLNAMTMQRLSMWLQFCASGNATHQQAAAIAGQVGPVSGSGSLANNGSGQQLSAGGSTNDHSQSASCESPDDGTTTSSGLVTPVSLAWSSYSDLFSCVKCNKIFGTPHGLEVRGLL